MADATKLVHELHRRKLTVAVAESCTGGMVAAALTDVPGSSEVFGWGVVAYSNQAKETLLGVAPETLAEYGAVSSHTATEMVSGMLKLSGAKVALATTGIAGPGGGTEEKPVGQVYIGCGDHHYIKVKRCRFHGDRDSVRRHTVHEALDMLEKYLEEGK
ncbi:MAG: nicotinamide-nucleotide amidohydrolase family protein [Firmicutes bacterium]|nr:nicotinamide-nucleotide amidohydrolase family protein [Bacillota bacterium]